MKCGIIAVINSISLSSSPRSVPFPLTAGPGMGPLISVREIPLTHRPSVCVCAGKPAGHSHLHAVGILLNTSPLKNLLSQALQTLLKF